MATKCTIDAVVFSCVHLGLIIIRCVWHGVTGALQGFNKDTAWKELGLDQELVMQMRRSYDVRPPRMEDDHIHWHGNDRRYDA